MVKQMGNNAILADLFKDSTWVYSPDDSKAMTPKNQMIVRRGVPVDIQREDRFSPVNGFAFNPMSQDYVSVDNAVLLMLLKQVSRDPKALVALMAAYMKHTTDILNGVLNASKFHPLAALNSHILWACAAHRFGIINDSHYLKIADQTRSMFDKLFTVELLPAIGAVLAGPEKIASGLISKMGDGGDSE